MAHIFNSLPAQSVISNNFFFSRNGNISRKIENRNCQYCPSKEKKM